MENYQKLAARTLIDAPDFEISGKDLMVIWNAIRLAGSVGRVCERLKKGVFHQHGLNEDELKSDIDKVVDCIVNMRQDITLGSELPFSTSDKGIMTLWNIIGLVGESGEICEFITDNPTDLMSDNLDRQRATKEIGDAFWYIAALCTKLDLDMNDVMAQNIEKLKVRYPDGYNSEDSKRRVDVWGVREVSPKHPDYELLKERGLL